MKALIVDDANRWVLAMKQRFAKNSKVVVELVAAYDRATAVAKAVNVIEKHRPNILFLDHSLSGDGGEGLEIAKRVMEQGEIKIYSTSLLGPSVLAQYPPGTEWVGKDATEIAKIIELQQKAPLSSSRGSTRRRSVRKQG